jgi:uncharacterized protein (TIGR02266 family)
MYGATAVNALRDKVFVNRDGNVDEIMPTEQRRSVRFPIHLSVTYGENSPVEYTSFIVNVNKGGVFIKTDKPLEEETRVVMKFYIPPQLTLLGEFTGKVVWKNDTDEPPTGMGIKLTDCSEAAMRRLEAFLEEKEHLINRVV